MTISEIIYFRNTLLVRVLNKSSQEKIQGLRLSYEGKQVNFIEKSISKGWDKNFNHQLTIHDSEFSLYIPNITKQILLKSSIVVVSNNGQSTYPVNKIKGFQNKKLVSQFEKLVFEKNSSKSQSTFLEIGSRSRSGNIYTDEFKTKNKYIGFDIEEGDNVDVVGDAHILSSYIKNKSVDFAFSISTFEHLLCPWVAAVELNKVLKIGGIGYIQSHQSWPVHEEPADYFRFSKYAWEGLFNKLTGFELLGISNENPCFIIPSRYDLHGRRPQFENEIGYMMSCCLIRKTGESTVNWDLNQIPLHELTGRYPK